MNKREKEIQQAYLNNEKAVLKKLEGNYKDALGEINSKIEILMARQDADMQHVIYQVEYQKALKTQVQAILETLQANEFETLSEYLTKSYEDGFIGTMYNLQGQGIPLVFPIDQEQVVAAIQHETKLSESLYTALGKDVVDLRKKIAGEISRGISSGQMYGEIARNIAGYAMIPKNNAMRIARTEAHRIQCKASMNACYKAKEKGADVVKQWDSSLDGKTRPTHKQLDGQIRELDEPFEVAGKKAMQPGDFGDPAEDCNCRCALLQRARWALGNDYTKWSPDAPVVIDDDGTTQFTIIEAKNYEDFQKKYKQASERVRENVQKMKIDDIQTFDDFNNYWKEKGVEVSEEIFDFSAEALKETTKGVEAMLERYPKLKNHFKGFDVVESGVATYSNGYMNLNPYYYKPDEEYGGIVEVLDFRDNGYHPKGAGAFQTACHEMGHALIDEVLYQVHDDYVSVAGARDSFVGSVVKKSAKEFEGKKLKDLKASISRYALVNNNECIAEAVADVMCNNEDAAEFSKAILKELERRMGK